MQTTDKTKKNRISISTMKTDTIPLKKLLNEQSKTMAALNNHVDSLNTKGKRGDNTVYFSNLISIALQRPEKCQN